MHKLDRIAEFYLSEIDAWESGAKATPGCPANGINYAGRMRDAIARLEAQLKAHREQEPTCSE